MLSGLILLMVLSPAIQQRAADALSSSDIISGDIIIPPPPLPLLDARDDTATTNEDTPVRINVLSNDNYIGVGSPRVTSVTTPSHGTAMINADNTVRYIPSQNFFGSDSFTYTITDGTGLLTDTARVSITINPVNDAPDARDDTATTNENTPVNINVRANDVDPDGDSLTVISVTTPSSGTAVINADKTITYTPNQGFVGTDSFTYNISDGNGGTDTATVTVTVGSINDVPVANDDSATTNEETPVTTNVLANDSDANGDALSVTAASDPPHGSTVVNGDNTITYTPDANFAGLDSFDYTISDGRGGTDTASVFVTVKEVSVFTIKQVQSGLVNSDPLNNETKTMEQLKATNGTYWTYGGSANTLFNPPAPRDLFKDSEGLHIGVQTPENGKYAGYYAVTPPTNAALFHAVISTPVRTITGDFFQNGLYVQTGPQDGRINYVTCVSITSTAGTSWHIVRTFGNFDQATEFEVLWSDPTPRPDQPLTKDCTIITNGNNYLKIYLDGIKVYENRTIDLQMPAPFSYFLEPQNSHAEMLYGIYKDFYATTDENIKVTNAPITAARVDVVDASGNVRSSAPVSDGTAILDVGRYHFPLAATIKVYDSANTELASSAASIFGGDVYSVNPT